MTEAGRPILLLEPWTEHHRRLSSLCEQRGFVLESADTVEAALSVLRRRHHLLVLVAAVPGRIDGPAACRTLRTAGLTMPVIVLGATGDPVEAILAFELGADDVVRTPYEPRELVARIDAHVRRLHRVERDIVHGPLRISPSRRMVWREGVEVALTRTEFDILLALARRLDRPMSREELMRETAMHGDADARTVDAHIHRLRRKLEPCVERPTFIQSVTRQGYRLVSPRAHLAGAA